MHFSFLRSWDNDKTELFPKNYYTCLSKEGFPNVFTEIDYLLKQKSLKYYPEKRNVQGTEISRKCL